jgi:hypothetical protein
MRFSTRSKAGGLLSLLTIVTILSAFVLNGLLSHGTITHASSGQSYSADKGIITSSATVDLKKLPTNLPLTAGASLPKGVRHMHPTGKAG